MVTIVLPKTVAGGYADLTNTFSNEPGAEQKNIRVSGHFSKKSLGRLVGKKVFL